MILPKDSSITPETSYTTSHHQDLVPTQYFGLKNLLLNHFNTINLIEIQLVALLLFVAGTFFFSYLLSFIVLATFIEFNPLDTFVGTYNFDATTNYQFNPSLLILLMLFFGICIVILFAQFILAFDIRKAKLSDSVMNTAVEFINKSNSTDVNNSTEDELRRYFIESNSTNMGFNFTNLISLLIFAFITVFLVMIWVLIKS